MMDKQVKKLQRLCKMNNPSLSEVFGYIRQGVRYIASTNGHAAVMIRSEIELPLDTFGFKKALAGYRKGKRLSFDQLKKFAGRAIFERKCKKCAGKGTCPHCGEYCSDCDASGLIRPEKREGQLNEVWLDRNLLACALAIVPTSDQIYLSLPDNYDQIGNPSACKPIFITGADWMIALMPVRMQAEMPNAPKLDV